jgi:hypothetical protein
MQPRPTNNRPLAPSGGEWVDDWDNGHHGGSGREEGTLVIGEANIVVSEEGFIMMKEENAMTTVEDGTLVMGEWSIMVAAEDGTLMMEGRGEHHGVAVEDGTLVMGEGSNMALEEVSMHITELEEGTLVTLVMGEATIVRDHHWDNNRPW